MNKIGADNFTGLITYMVLELKSFELEQQKFAEYIRVKAPFRWQVALNDVACFIYWLNGRNTLYTPNQLVSSSGKEALLLRCGAYIDQIFPDGEEEIAAVIIHFYPELLKSLFRNEIPETLKPSSHPLPVHLGQDDLLEKYIDSLLFYFQHPHLADKELLSLKLKELVLLLGKTQQRHTLEQIFRHLFAPEEVSFQTVIEAHLYSGLGLKELAHLTHRSLATFKRDFEKYYKAAPAHYFQTKRLEKAAQLLRSTQLRITDVVFECGFTNLSHFTRLFHRTYKVSPTAYRMSQTAKSLS